MLLFRWEYLDRNQVVTCGKDKCLFRSSSRVSTTNTNTHLERETGWDCSIRRETQRPAAATTTTTTGYLVSRKKNKYNEAIFDGWKIAEYLTYEFGIKHFLLEPPIQPKIDKSTAQALFLRRDRGRHNHNNKTKEEIKDEANLADAYGQFFGSSADDDNDNGDNNGNDNANANDNDSVTTTVQKIRIALDYVELRLKHPERVVQELLESVSVESSTIETSNVKRKTSTHGEPVTRCGTPLSIFFERLDAGVAKTLELLRCEPLMALDFQVMVDAGGNLYHLDFDRVMNQLGGLQKYNQTHFDSEVRDRLEGATEVLSTVRRWIQTKQHQHQQNTTTTTPDVVPTRNASSKCQRNWEDEESAILVSRTLSCLATERVAMVRNTIDPQRIERRKKKAKKRKREKAAAKGKKKLKGDGDNDGDGENATPTPPHQQKRERERERLLRQRAKGNVDDNDDDDYQKLKHPLLVALLQRVIEGGFYDGEGVAERNTWDCNVYGDRAVS